MNSERMLRRAEVERISGLSRASIYRLAKSGQFPKPRRIGPRASAWVASEIEAWVKARARGEPPRSESRIQQPSRYEKVLRAMLDGTMQGTIVVGGPRGVRLMPIGKPYTLMPSPRSNQTD